MLVASLRGSRLRLALLLGAAIALVITLLPAPGGAQDALDPLDYGFQGEGEGRIRDLDRRTGRLAPTAEQVALAEQLDAEVRWNAFGTPHMMSNWTGYLSGPRSGPAVDVARAWVAANRGLFRLEAAEVTALEVVRDSPLYDSTDLRRIQRGLQPRNTDVGHAVLFRQRLADLDAGRDGLLGLGVDAQGRIVSAWSSVTGATEVTNVARLTWQDAYRAAAADVGREADLSALTVVDNLTQEGFTTFRVPGASDLQYVRLSAIPTPQNGVRLAWETVVLDATDPHGHPEAYIHFIDAQTGDVILRQNQVDHFAAPDTIGGPSTLRSLRSLTEGRMLAQSDEEGDGIPYWQYFPAFPKPVGPLDEAVPDTRQRWCWVPGPECDLIVGPGDTGEEADPVKPFAWDVDPRTGQSTQTTEGNNARTAISEGSPLTPDTPLRRPVSPSREYDYPWTNVWFTSQCDPSNFNRPDRNRNDEDAATVNLFVGHNRVHDWAYLLGYTEENSAMQRDNFGKTTPGPYPVGREEDPENGQSQAGRLNAAFLGRDNANQITLQDGIPGVTNQYLWQPLQAGFYAPCVDGAYDMSIVGHEYGHAIQHRMTAGPDQGLGGAQGRSMGESWSDLTAMEYGNGYGFVPVGNESPYAVGPYATGDGWAAIRNYNMSASPLNFSDIEYDGNGTTSPHADGEIWSALNFDIRAALIAKYNAEFPAGDQGLQTRCADGLVPVEQCPGNRRWIQLMHDGFLLQPDAVSMIDARDAVLAADKARFGGANQRELWDAFAARGLGQEAATTIGQVCVDPVFASPCPPQSTRESGADDREPTPGWTSPLRSNPAMVTFDAAPVGDAPAAEDMQVFVGVYEARATPAADTDPDTEIPAKVAFNPGTYEFIARAPGHGAFRFTQTFTAGQTTTVRVPLRINHASFFNDSVAAGDGGNLEELIDDTERTNWASFNEGPVEGKQVTVQLGTGRQTIRQVQVSAALRPQGTSEDPADEREPSEEPSEEPDDDPPYDTGGQNRFSALRQFEILTCDTTSGKTCEEEGDFTSIYTSAADAFPAFRPRPRAPELTLRPFDVPPTPATHVRIKVLNNQCTGQPLYNGENNPDADPGNDPDCVSGFSTIGAANTNQERRDNSQAEVVRIAELQVFGDAEPFLGDPCGGVQVASSYLDRISAREVHQRSIDCVIFRRIAVGQEADGAKFYRPLQDVTRGQMASFIVNDLISAGHGDALLSGPLPNQFSDIDTDVHRRNINILATAEIISGTGGGRYSPKARVSREQMATFMMNAYRFAAGETEGDGTPRFRDVSRANVHRTNIETGADLGLFSGVTNTRFEPAAQVKRDQMASFLINLLRSTAPQFR